MKEIFNEFIKKYKFMILAIFILVVLLISGTYAWTSLELFGEKVNTLNTGEIVVELDENNCTEIDLDMAAPITDKEGMKLVSCDFSLTNSGSNTVDYFVYLDDAELQTGEVRMNDRFIKYGLVINDLDPIIGKFSDIGTSPNRVIDNGVLEVGKTNNYKLRLWVDYDATNEAMNKAVATKLRVVSNLFREQGCLDIPSYGGIANAPVLEDGMIPVSYDEESGNWIKVAKSNPSNSWYDYNYYMWANVVTVTSATRENYMNADIGSAIAMDDINSMFVWIPRYSYTLKDTYGVQGCEGATPSALTPGAFDIKFVNNGTTELGTASYTGDVASEWYTHPSFCWGSSCDVEATRGDVGNKELDGIWVAKFETGTTDATCNTTSNEDNCNKILQPIIKPNINSWREVNIANGFNSLMTYMNGDNGSNIYGFSGTDYDTHMMKNTDWGAVAYLTQSRYGKYGNDEYSGTGKEVGVNNCTTYITGIGDMTSANGSSTSCVSNTYETSLGQGASTTGNIYGIYDMVGGANENIMGTIVYRYSSVSGSDFYPHETGFSGVLESKYYNIHYGGINSFIKGDATKEVAGLYNDDKIILDYNAYWSIRGGSIGSGAGIFAFSRTAGDVNNKYSFRAVLVNEN